MCLAVPVRIAALIEGDRAIAEIDGITKEISLALVEGVGVGDYVILHVGYAISRLDEAQAQHTLELLARIGQAGPGAPQ